MFRFFIQPQLNTKTQTVIGYELLMKEYRDGCWQIPTSFLDIPAVVIADTLIKTADKLSIAVESISVNVNRHQIQDKHLMRALTIAQEVVRPVRLIIELTENDVTPMVPNEQLIQIAQHLNSLGIDFCLDDVGSGVNTWPKIEPLLPFTSELKYALQNYKENLDQVETKQTVTFWRDLAQKNSLRFILEGIDNERDNNWADSMQIDLRQGYYYGKPRLMKIKDNDPD